MNIRVALVFILLLCELMACGGSGESTADENSVADTSQPVRPQDALALPADTLDQITGLLQTSGLQSDEAKALGITHGRYQLLSQTPYFLDGPDSLETYLGQCLQISGKFAADRTDTASQEVGQASYGRKIFIVESVVLQPSAHCFYSDSAAVQPQGREVTYTGLIARMERPAPDIAYDYELQLQKPYRDANNPNQPGKLVQRLPLVSDNFEVLNSLEQALRQKRRMHIRGVQHQGYAEREALWIVVADSLAL